MVSAERSIVGNERLTEHTVEVTDLLAAVRNAEVQAILLYGPPGAGKSRLVQDLMQALPQAGDFAPICLSLRDVLERSRTEIIHDLAVGAVNATHQAHTLLDDLSPNRFHNEFMAQLLDGIPMPGMLLFVFDNIDLSDRSQLSKLNNLLLPLLRRLALLERLKFMLVLDDSGPEKMQSLVEKIFPTMYEIALVPPLSGAPPTLQEQSQSSDHLAAEASGDPAEKAASSWRKTLLLILLMIVISILLLNIYLLLSVLNQVQ